MADKILSLASIKKCLEKVKSWAARKFNDCYSNKGDFENPDMNNLVNLGFYRYHGGITNGPDALSSAVDDYGLISTIRNKDYVSQLVFPLHSRGNQTICHRTGTTTTITDKPWLYFHGSTSPNIPVLKQATFESITTDTNGHYNTTMHGIPLCCYTKNKNDSSSVKCVCWNTSDNIMAITFYSNKNQPYITTVISDLVLYYLEIPTDYEIPDATPASSDEPDLEDQPSFEE